MAKKKDQKKGVFCLEGPWFGLKDRTSMEPVLAAIGDPEGLQGSLPPLRRRDARGVRLLPEKVGGSVLSRDAPDPLSRLPWRVWRDRRRRGTQHLGDAGRSGGASRGSLQGTRHPLRFVQHGCRPRSRVEEVPSLAPRHSPSAGTRKRSTGWSPPRSTCSFWEAYRTRPSFRSAAWRSSTGSSRAGRPGSTGSWASGCGCGTEPAPLGVLFGCAVRHEGEWFRGPVRLHAPGSEAHAEAGSLQGPARLLPLSRRMRRCISLTNFRVSPK